MEDRRIAGKIEQMLDRFPWYGSLLGDERTQGRLPLITSDTLERFYYVADTSFSELSNITSYRTSGTSSRRRKTIYYSEEDERRYVRIKAELFRRILADTNASTALSDMGTGHAASTALDIFRQIGIDVDSIDFHRPIAEHLERLGTLRPHVLYTMPSILDHLLSASAADPSYGIRHVILVGEIASPAWRRSVAERLGLTLSDITDTYGSIEIGTIAYYSHEHGRYLLAEGIEAEGIPAEDLDDDMDPLPEGESVLVLTSYARELFPALRYVTYDIVRDLRPILVDGEWRQSFKAIVRRVGTELKHGEKISVYDIEDVVYRHLKDANVRVRVSNNKLEVHIDSEERRPESYEQIERELADRIPEIGVMIRGGMLDALRVVPGKVTFEGSVLKHKKIFHDGEATSG